MRALQRLIGIIEVVAELDAPATVTVVSERVGLSLSTTARLMRELESEGLLERVSENGPYVLGLRLVAIAHQAMKPSGLVEAAIPIMRELRDLTNETVTLHVRREHLRICVAQVESRQQIRRVVPIGYTAPLHGGATSEVLLAGLPPDERAAYVAKADLSEFERDLLERRIADIQVRGWALTVDTVESGLAGISTGVRVGDEVIASLSISAPSSRWTVPDMTSYIDDLARASANISARLAGRYSVPHEDSALVPSAV